MTVIFISNSSAFAILAMDDEESRSTLKGLKGVYVLVQFFQEKNNNLNEIGLSEDVIRTDVELKLRMAGVNVVSKDEALQKLPVIPQLVIEIMGLTTAGAGEKGPKQITSTVSIMLIQPTSLVRDPGISALAVTWLRGGYVYGLANKRIAANIRNIVKDCVDVFINAYLSVNPKGGK